MIKIKHPYINLLIKSNHNILKSCIQFYHKLIILAIKQQTILKLSIMFILITIRCIYTGLFADEIANMLKEQMNDPYNTRIQILADGSTVPRISDGYGFQYAVLTDGTLLPLGKEIHVKDINPGTDAADGNAWVDNDTSTYSESTSEEEKEQESNASNSESSSESESEVPNKLLTMTQSVVEFNHLLADVPEEQFIKVAITFVKDIIPLDVLAKNDSDITNPDSAFTVWYDDYFKENEHIPVPDIYIPALFSLQAAMCTNNLITGMGLAIDDPLTEIAFKNSLEFIVKTATGAL